MREILTILFLTVAVTISCDNQNHRAEKNTNPIKSETLLNKLDELIDFRDSLAEHRDSRKIKSYWIYFSYRDNDCFVTILAHPLDTYDRKEMDGYFMHRDRFVSVYDSNTKCGTDFIDTELLLSGDINEFIDYWPDNKDSSPAFPSHNAYGREFLIINKDNLELISDGYHLGRPLPEHRIPPKPDDY